MTEEYQGQLGWGPWQGGAVDGQGPQRLSREWTALGRAWGRAEEAGRRRAVGRRELRRAEDALNNLR